MTAQLVIECIMIAYKLLEKNRGYEDPNNLINYHSYILIIARKCPGERTNNV